jgi:FixJ family two-component response regulator
LTLKTGKSIVAVVENDAAMLRALERLLRASGYTSEMFTSAESFMTRTSDAAVDCLILDIDLDGISGLSLQKRLVDAGTAPPIIFITGKFDELSRTQAMELGCKAYLRKPFESKSLLFAVEGALNAPDCATR